MRRLIGKSGLKLAGSSYGPFMTQFVLSKLDEKRIRIYDEQSRAIHAIFVQIDDLRAAERVINDAKREWYGIEEKRA